MTAEVLPIRRGRPSNADLTERLARARERNALLNAERRARSTEEQESWGRVLVLSTHIHRLVPTFDHGPIREVEQRSAELAHLASRRIKQLGGDAA